MSSVRRWYLYLVCFAALQAVTWAVIDLLRNLIGGESNTTVLAWQIAVLVVALPLFLGHWLWAERLVRADPDERASTIRHIYLYGLLAVFLIAISVNAYTLIELLFARFLGEIDRVLPQWSDTTAGQMLLDSLIALVVLAVLAAYNWQVLRRDCRITSEAGELTTVRRVFVYGLSGYGLILTAFAVAPMLDWIILQLTDPALGGAVVVLSSELARLAVGLPLWLVFWGWAQRLFGDVPTEERTALLRRSFLFIVIFLSAVTCVSIAILMAGDLVHSLIGRPTQGGDSRAAPALITTTVVWAYHAVVVNRDAHLAVDSKQQAAIRRPFFYLIASVGLAATLTGLAGVVSELVRPMIPDLRLAIGSREALASFVAMIAVGLPVWLIPWFRTQQRAAMLGTPGDDEAGSLARRIYLYGFLLVATLTILGSAVFIVAKIVGTVLGSGREISISETRNALALSLIAAGTWAYHGWLLRSDGQRLRKRMMERLSAIRVVILSDEGDEFGRALTAQLTQRLPGIIVTCLGLTRGGVDELSRENYQQALGDEMLRAQVLIAPWSAAVASIGETGSNIAALLASSLAHKILLPASEPGWVLTGQPAQRKQDIVKQAVDTVEQIVEGKEATPKRSWSLTYAFLVTMACVGLGVLLLVLTAMLSAFMTAQ